MQYEKNPGNRIYCSLWPTSSGLMHWGELAAGQKHQTLTGSLKKA